MSLVVFKKLCFVLVLIYFILTGCSLVKSSPGAGGSSDTRKLRIVATTTIVGDVVKNIAGERTDLHILIPAGVDEHSFQYTPKDLAHVADADIIFMNGAGLETFMKALLENAGGKAQVISVSDGIQLKQGVLEDEPAPGNGKTPLIGNDPHVWTDPNNVLIWSQNIAAALSKLDPAHTAEYQANSSDYKQKLSELDGWIQEQAAQVPEPNRQLVTDHQMFTYFANRYGFKQLGAVIPSYSTDAEPSAQELAMLENAIRQYGVKAIFIGNTVNPSLANRIAADTNVHLVPIYTGSLTNGEPAGTYLDYMHFNVGAIVQALN